MDNGHLVRYSAPTKFDSADYGKIWEQMIDDGTKTYIQVSKDSESPEWLEIGKFFEKVFKTILYDEGFIMECLERYKS